MAAETYVTIQGDTFESVAWSRMGDSGRMTDLIRANPRHFETAVFPAGVELTIPETEKKTAEGSRPPWRR